MAVHEERHTMSMAQVSTSRPQDSPRASPATAGIPPTLGRGDHAPSPTLFRAQGASSSRIRKGTIRDAQAVQRIGVATVGIEHALGPWRRPDLQQPPSSNASSFARSGRPAESAITFSEPGVWFEGAGDDRQSLYQTAVIVRPPSDRDVRRCAVGIPVFHLKRL